MVSFDLDKLSDLLNSLTGIPNIKEVRELRKRLKKERQKIIKEKPKEIPVKVPTVTKSSKLKKYHRYIRLIRNNFPELTYNQIRKQFAKRKSGQNVSIPDVVWQNPSP